jgi:four helix bundle protein
MAEAEDFTRIVVWQKGQQLAAAVIAIVAGLPRNRAADVIGTQVLRSAGSVPANIAEGYGRFSQAAYRHHLSIARGSLFETQSWLDLLARTGHLDESVKDRLVLQCQEVGKLLTLRMKSLGESNLTYAREERVEYVLEEP